jgi:hypothetical protein
MHVFPKRSHAAYLFILLLVAGFGQGCNDGRPERVPVTGQVFLDGKPLDGADIARIQVAPKGARPAIGKIDSEGRFVLTTFEMNDGCVPGAHPVAVIYNKPIGENGIHWLLPKKYADPLTSGLTVTIKGPTDDLKVDVTWDGGKPFKEFH